MIGPDNEIKKTHQSSFGSYSFYEVKMSKLHWIFHHCESLHCDLFKPSQKKGREKKSS